MAHAAAKEGFYRVYHMKKLFKKTRKREVAVSKSKNA
jgi:hypothetical protein